MTPKKPDTYSYKGWMASDYFWKRAFSVLYHYAAASVIVSVALGILSLIIGAIIMHFVNTSGILQGITGSANLPGL